MTMSMGTVTVRALRLGAPVRVTTATVVVCLLAGLVTSEFANAVPARAAGVCLNEAVREEQGAATLALPECRAYELVTPPGVKPNLESTHNPIVGHAPKVEAEASVSGGAAAFKSWYTPVGSAVDGDFFRSRRSGDGWLTEDLSPSSGPGKEICGFETMYFSSDLIRWVYTTLQGSGFCPAPEPPVVAGEPRATDNLLAKLEEAGDYRLVNAPPEDVVPANARFQGASADFSHVVFDEEAPLVGGAPAGDDLYEWDEGSLYLVTYLPGGTPVLGSIVAMEKEFAGDTGFGGSPATLVHAVSGDGERVVFEASGALYLRVNAAREQSKIAPEPPRSGAVDGEQCVESEKACTIQLDVSQGGSGTSGGGVFRWATPDGSRIYFTDASRLTANATALSGKPDLYEYDVETGVLTDLTPDSQSYPANVQGVMGASEDGSYLYFVADGVLAENENSPAGAKAVLRQPNLYVRHAGATTFVATLNPGDSFDWGVYGTERQFTTLSSDVSPDGGSVAFNSVMELTGYSNTPASPDDCEGTYLSEGPGEPCNEIFVYEALANRLDCVSCGPVRAAPAGLAELRAPQGSNPLHPMAADGSVFFDTPSSLLSQDSNGVSNVYEWAPVGVGGCEASSASFNSEANGCQYSLTSGISSEPSYFVDASSSGEDVFFVTGQSLVGEDSDEGGLSLYDARVGGGFPGSGPVVESPGCHAEEECRRSVGEGPVQSPPGSVTFAGSGNVTSIERAQSKEPGRARKLTRSQKLADALAACRKGPKRKRKACEASARRRYGTKAKAKTKHARGKGGRR